MREVHCRRPNKQPLKSGQAVVLFACAFFVAAGLSGCGDSASTRLTLPVSPTATPVADTAGYRYGAQIDFGESGDSARYKRNGWGAPEKESTWTDGTAAVLELEPTEKAGPLRLKTTLSGFVKPPELPVQMVDIVVNNEAVAHWEIASKGEASTTIPLSVLQKNKRLRIEFRIPTAASPASLGVSADNRRLGICIYNLVLGEPAP